MLAIVMLVLGASAPSALAGEVTFEGNTVVFTALEGASHEVQFRYNSGTGEDEILDTQPITSAPAGCTAVFSDTWISCPAHGEVKVELGSGNDSFTTAHSTMGDCFFVYTINLGEGTNSNDMNTGCTDAAIATITAGSGNDTLRGGSASTSVTIVAGGGADTLNGGDGDDIIHGGDGNEAAIAGGPGNDQLFGEGGNDVIRGADGNDLEDGGTGDDDIGESPGISNDDDLGADQLRGGDGTDRLRLDGHPSGVNITLDGVANDGSPGEGDNIATDFEAIDGTNSSDVFVGSPGNDSFSGGPGNDEIRGAGGADDLAGGSGDDRVFGDAGNDIVEGTNGADIVDGGAGSDQIYGDIANCSVFCNSDADQLFARDGERDVVDCGGGADSAQVDQLDIVAFCLVVDRQTVAVPGSPAAPGPGAGSAAAALGLSAPSSIRRSVLLRRGVTFRLRCAGACTIVAELRYKTKKLGSVRKRLRTAGAARLTVKVSKKARRTVRRLRRGTLTLRVKVTDAAGTTTTVTKRIKLRR